MTMDHETHGRNAGFAVPAEVRAPGAFAARKIDEVRARIAPLRARLLEHPIYHRIVDLEALRVFMEHHVFAVFDFMSLLAALRNGVLGSTGVWRPRGSSLVRRFLNDIMIGEESDVDGHGGYASHFETYLLAMRAAGADTTAIERCVAAARSATEMHNVLRLSGAPIGAVSFSSDTFDSIAVGDVAMIAGSFTFGREEVIPDMFRRMVADLDRQHGRRLERFIFYLDRHIKVDEGDHAPMAMKLLEAIGGDDIDAWRRIGDGAERALSARILFWDAIVAAVDARLRLASAEMRAV